MVKNPGKVALRILGRSICTVSPPPPTPSRLFLFLAKVLYNNTLSFSLCAKVKALRARTSLRACVDVWRCKKRPNAARPVFASGCKHAHVASRPRALPQACSQPFAHNARPGHTSAPTCLTLLANAHVKALPRP